MASTSRESTTPSVSTTWELLPLRLIDVDATLEAANQGRILLCQTDDWNFHVISHTWSQYIRDLSRAVEIQAAHSGAEGEQDEYRAAFEARDWIKEGKVNEKLSIAYDSVKEFLEILHSQGVKKVWLDAICINQGSKQEKEREISLMKDFYGRSLACYVPVNGFADEKSKKVCKGVCGSQRREAARSVRRKLVHRDGKIWNLPFPVFNDADGSESGMDQLPNWKQVGTSASGKGCDGCGGVNDYRLFAGTNLMDLRWMNRVWTLQELILPERIYFIVQLETWMEEWLAMGIETNLPRILSCSIFKHNASNMYRFSFVLDLEGDERARENFIRSHKRKIMFARHNNRAGMEALLGCDYAFPMTCKALIPTNQNRRPTPVESDDLDCDHSNFKVSKLIRAFFALPRGEEKIDTNKLLFFTK